MDNDSVGGKNVQAILSAPLMQPAVFWFTGLSGAGKTTLALALKNNLAERNIQSVLLDGDEIRKGLNRDLGFSDNDRSENIRRIIEVADLLFQNGICVIVAAISPFRIDREKARNRFPTDRFFEIYLNASFEVCAKRDVKGLYEKALSGEIKSFTGVESKYEEPLNAEVVLDTAVMSVENCLDEVLKFIKA